MMPDRQQRAATTEELTMATLVVTPVDEDGTYGEPETFSNANFRYEPATPENGVVQDLVVRVAGQDKRYPLDAYLIQIEE